MQFNSKVVKSKSGLGKRSLSWLLSLVLVLGSMYTPMGAYAEDTAADKTGITITTDKEAYTNGETVTADVKVTNGNEGILSDVKLEGIAPSGYTVEENPTAPTEISAGGTVNYSIRFLDSDITPTYAVKQKVNIADRFKTSEKITKYIILDKKEKKLASVSKKGLVTCKKPGTVTVTAYKTVKNGKKKSYEAIGTYALKIEKPEVKVKTLKLKAGSTDSLDAKSYITAQEALISSWHTSNRKVASIDEKTGLITIHKKGSAKITAWYGEGKQAAKYSFTVKADKSYITSTAAKEAATSPFNGNNTVSVKVKIDGRELTFAAKISYTVNDVIPPTVYYTVSFDTKGGSSIAPIKVEQNKTIDPAAIAIPEKEGCVFGAWYTDEEYTDEYDFSRPVTGDMTLYAYWDVKKVIDVTSEEDLENALKDDPDSYKDIYFHTEDNIIVDISGDYPRVDIKINTPNGHINNEASFHTVTLVAVSDSTYVDKAAMQRIIIDNNSVVRILTGSEGEQQLDILNRGLINLTLNNKSNVTISGSSDKISASRNKVTVKENAKGSRVRTSQNIDLSSACGITLVLDPTAINNIADIKNSDAALTVEGIGQITVTNNETGDVEVILADSTKYDSGEKLTLSGKVFPESAEAYLLPYSQNLDADSIGNSITAATPKAVKEGGRFKFEDVKAGNYYLVTTASTYVTEFKSISISPLSASGYMDAGVIHMTSEADTVDTVSVHGYITDIQSSDVINYPVRIRVFRGIDVASGTTVKDVTSASDGTYDLGALNKGNYTLQIIGADDTHPIVPSTERLVVDDNTMSGEANEDSYEAAEDAADSKYEDEETASEVSADSKEGYEISVKSGNADLGEVSFVLWWNHNTGTGEHYSDLDSHLSGPSALTDGRLHTWYSDRENYGEDDYCVDKKDEHGSEIRYASLDRDDTTYHGPETTTIYRKTPGKYSFYIFNYSNRYPDDICMSTYSDAYVQLFVNGNQITTYNIPYGATGPLWYVCDYDSATGMFTPVNSLLRTHENGVPFDDEDIGLEGEMLSLYLTKLKREPLRQAIDSAKDYALAGSLLSTMISRAQGIYDNTGSTEEDVDKAINELTSYVNSLTTLDSTISSATNLLSTEEGTGLGAKINKAQTVRNNINATYEQLQGATTELEAYLTASVPRITEISVSADSVLYTDTSTYIDYSAIRYINIYSDSTDPNTLGTLTVTTNINGVNWSVEKNASEYYPLVITLTNEASGIKVTYRCTIISDYEQISNSISDLLNVFDSLLEKVENESGISDPDSKISAARVALQNVYENEDATISELMEAYNTAQSFISALPVLNTHKEYEYDCYDDYYNYSDVGSTRYYYFDTNIDENVFRADDEKDTISVGEEVTDSEGYKQRKVTLTDDTSGIVLSWTFSTNPDYND
ncbi:MAG: InlB B-repeat-containing protein [Lachnospiraceae bacterium]|nr:InlB B-repeat-containing protein [Lachnospiraceae bacterium]